MQHTVQRLDSKEIDKRLSVVPYDVLEDLEKDVKWNFDRIFLPGFENGLFWNDEPRLYSPNEVCNSEWLPELAQWEELEQYSKEAGIGIQGLYKMLGMYPIEKSGDHQVSEDDFKKIYLCRENWSFARNLFSTKRGVHTIVMQEGIDEGDLSLKTPVERGYPLILKDVGNFPHYNIRLQAS